MSGPCVLNSAPCFHPGADLGLLACPAPGTWPGSEVTCSYRADFIDFPPPPRGYPADDTGVGDSEGAASPAGTDGTFSGVSPRPSPVWRHP